MPFHSTETEEEALELVVSYCRMGYDGCYRITQEWSSQDIITAMRKAAERFGLEPKF
jgi:hypothetical protein